MKHFPYAKSCPPRIVRSGNTLITIETFKRADDAKALARQSRRVLKSGRTLVAEINSRDRT